jgi:hypothetical protein
MATPWQSEGVTPRARCAGDASTRGRRITLAPDWRPEQGRVTTPATSNADDLTVDDTRKATKLRIARLKVKFEVV